MKGPSEPTTSLVGLNTTRKLRSGDNIATIPAKETQMLACVDVGYNDSAARAACVTFDDWKDADPRGEYTLDIDQVEPYVPGQFYR